MPPNRLALNWGLNLATERRDFVESYLTRPEFIKKPLTDDELETISNYILFGKDPDGQSPIQKGEFEIETRNKTWQRDNTESLDAMMESPTFNEASLRAPTEARIKIAREVFDRKKALSECPEYMRPTFVDLFQRIDDLELAIQFYDCAHGRRKEPPSETFLRQFSESQIETAKQKADTWTQRKYLKFRHLIVELRREQYTLRDVYIEKHLRHTPPEPELAPSSLDIEVEIPVLPLGTIGTQIGGMVFREIGNLNTKAYTLEELGMIARFYWDKHSAHKPKLYFDFRDAEHVYELVKQLEELEESIDALPLESNLKKLLDTLEYYIGLADLSDIQRDILRLKIARTKNADIAVEINRKYGKSYAVNYISTIFKQRIVPEINRIVALHERIVENLCFEENFKKCNTCGKLLLIDAENFMRRTRSKDGFANRCKICDRNDRQYRRVGE